MYDFHPEMFFPLFIFSAHYYLTVRKNNFYFFLFILLRCFIKERFRDLTYFFIAFGCCVHLTKDTGIWAAIAERTMIRYADIRRFHSTFSQS